MDDAISALTGSGYAQDPVRNIPCDIAGCEWMFSREYDLTQHKRVKHGIKPALNVTNHLGHDEMLQPDYGIVEATEPPYNGPPHIDGEPCEYDGLRCPHWDHLIVLDDYYVENMRAEEEEEEEAELRSQKALEYPEPPDYTSLSAAAAELGI